MVQQSTLSVNTGLSTPSISADLYKMASAQFLDEPLSSDADGRAVNAIVGTLENNFITTVPSVSCHNTVVNVLSPQFSGFTPNASFVISGHKYVTNGVNCSLVGNHFHSSAISNTNAVCNNVCTSTPTNSSSLSLNVTVSACSDSFQVIYSQAQNVSSSSCLTYPGQSTPSICALPRHVNSLASSDNSAIQQSLLLKQASSGQVGMQTGLVTVPMTVNSTMPTSIPSVMTLNKAGVPNGVSAQNIGAAQSAIMPNVQILNMRPGVPPVAPSKSVAAVSPRVVIGAPQVVGARAAAPGITLQTLQSLQPGQQGHLLLKTENGQYQLLRVGPAPTASTLTAPQPQTIRLSTVPTHPGVATVSTSMAPGPIPGQMPPAPVATPVVPSGSSLASITPPPLPPTVTTVKPSDNTKEKCRNFLANLLDLSSKEPPSVERNVRNLIQELIDAQVEPEEFCDRLEKLLNASPQPCLIGFLKKSLPLLRQSMVTKELVIEGINTPAPHIAFSSLPAPVQPVMGPTNHHMLSDDEGSSPTLTTLLPPVMPLSMAQSLMSNSKPLGILPVLPTPPMQLSDDEDGSSPTLTTLLPPVMPLPLVPTLVPNTIPNNVMSMQLVNSSTQKPAPKTNNTIAVLQNIPVHSKINVGKMNGVKSMTVNSKANFPRSGASSSALSTVLTPGKSLLKDKEKKSSSQFSSQPFGDDKMAGDDDINDVAAMGGVNLAEETQRILGSTEMIGTQIRSCKEEYLVSLNVMQARVKAAAARHNMEEPSPEVAAILSHAVHERLKNLIEKLAVVAQYRIDLVKTDSRYDSCQEVKGQLKFLEELDRVDKKRREDSEREMLLRAAKSRSKNEDPEQAKLKAKAKEMQRAELEELRQREANLTALQAIGPRKKPRMDGAGAAGDSVTNNTIVNGLGLTGRSQLALRTRLKRINYRDMISLMEQEQETSHSLMLYKSYLK